MPKIQCTLRNKIKVTILADICATRYSFIDEKFVKIIYQVLKIASQHLINPKQIQKFDGRAAKPIIYAIYLTLTIGTHTENFAFLLITKIENYPIIFGQPQMKKYGVVIDIENNSLAFWHSHYIYIEATSPITLSLPSLPTEIIAVKIEEAITSQLIMKKCSKEDIIDFLQMPDKLSSKKMRQIYKSK